MNGFKVSKFFNSKPCFLEDLKNTQVGCYAQGKKIDDLQSKNANFFFNEY